MDLNDVRIVEFPETRVAALEFRGPEAEIRLSVAKFIAWRKAVHLPPHVSRTFNIWHHFAPEHCRVDICAATDGPIAANDTGIVAKIIPGGHCAVLRHNGAESGLASAIAFLTGIWLAQSGESLRDFPFFLERVVFPPFVAEDEAVTDIYLPIR